MNFLILPFVWVIYQSAKVDIRFPIVCESVNSQPVKSLVIFPQLPGEQQRGQYWVQLGDADGVKPPDMVGEASGVIREGLIDLDLGIGSPQGTFKAYASADGRWYEGDAVLTGQYSVHMVCALRKRKRGERDHDVQKPAPVIERSIPFVEPPKAEEAPAAPRVPSPFPENPPY